MDKNLSDLIRNAISHSAIQDSLLQSFRNISLGLQSVFLAVGIFLLTRVVRSTNINDSLIYLICLIVVFIVGLWVTFRMRSIAYHRGIDVNFWHKQIIIMEQELEPGFRHFTQFKITQNQHRKGMEYLADIVEPATALSRKQIDQLIGKGLGHTRRVIDRYIPYSILFCWTMILIASIYKTYSVFNL